jgi:hypothetical protein
MIAYSQQVRLTHVLIPHSERFLLAIKYAFNTRQVTPPFSKLVFSSALLASCNIFATSIRASRILVPHFKNAVETILKSCSDSSITPLSQNKITHNLASVKLPMTTVVSDELYGGTSFVELRRACINVISGLCLSGRYYFILYTLYFQ